MAVALHRRPEPVAGAFPDSSRNFSVKCNTFIDYSPLLFAQVENISRKAHPSQKCIGQRIYQAALIILFPQDCPDLALPRQNSTVEVCCDNRDLDTFMRI